MGRLDGIFGNHAHINIIDIHEGIEWSTLLL